MRRENKTNERKCNFPISTFNGFCCGIKITSEKFQLGFWSVCFGLVVGTLYGFN